MTAAAGVSIMMPSSTSSLNGMPSAVSSALTRSHIFLASLTSQMLVTIGNMMPSLPYAEARYRARICVWKISGRFRQMRSARLPSAGFSSFGRLK